MQFLYPQFLWALSALAIPLVIHLFHLRRYKTIYFSDIRFLKDVEQTSRRQRKIKEYLVLASRMLALAALVFAFARPYIPSPNQATDSAKILLAIDNSPSNSVGLEQPAPLERGKEMALALLIQLPEDAEIALATAGNQTLFFQSKDAIKRQIENLIADDRSFSPASIAQRLQQTEADITVYWIGDLLKSTFDAEAIAASNWQWVLMPTAKPAETSIDNTFIDSVWVDAPFLLAGQPVQIHIRLKQNRKTLTETDLEILTNGLPEATLSITPIADTVIIATLTQLNNGYNTAQINILNDETGFDNNVYLAYYTPIANRVVEIWQDEPSSLAAKIFSDEEFDFHSFKVDRVDNQKILESDLIILHELTQLSPGLENLLAEQSNSSNLLIIPSANPTGLNSLLQKLGTRTYTTKDTATLATQSVNLQDPFFVDVFSGNNQKSYWPTVKQHFRLGADGRLPAFNLLTLANGAPLFIRYSRGNTNVFQLSTSLRTNWSDIGAHPLVIPLFIKSLIKKDNINTLTGTCGIDSRFDLTMDEEVNSQSTVSLHRANASYIPRQQIQNKKISMVAGSEHARKGYYHVQAGEEKLATLAFNIAPAESRISRFSLEELEKLIEDKKLTNISLLRTDASSLQANFIAWQQGKHLWRHFLLAALIFVLGEIILLRFLK